MKLIPTLIFAVFAAVLSAQNIVCTTVPVTAMTRAVLKNVPGFRIESLLPPETGCPHDYALTTGDMRKLAGADAIVMNGLGMENFLTPALKKLNRKTILFDSSKYVKNIRKSSGGHEHGDEHKHGPACHHHDGELNEHLFAAPGSAAEVVESLGRLFSEKYPKHAALIGRNAVEYATKLREIASGLAPLKMKKFKVAAQHNIFDYLADEAGMELEVYLQPNASQEPSTADLTRMIRELKKDKVNLILAEQGYPAKVANVVSKETGIPVLTLSAYDPSTDPDKFTENFRKNIQRLKAVLIK